MKIDYLIVGRGIAGTMLSYYLVKENKKVLVVDLHSTSASTFVAAGVLNPITGRRMAKSWMVDTLLPFAQQAYTELEELLQKKLLYKKNMIRLLPTDVEKNDALKKSNSPETAHYIEAIYEEITIPGLRKNFAAVCEIKDTGYVDTEVLLQSFGEYLLANGSLKEEIFSYDDIEFTDSGTIKWKDIEAGKIIFCEGYKGKNNPFFDDLPLGLTKGEILTIHAPGLETDKIISKGLYIVPVGDDIFKIGATYEWTDQTENITDKGREDLVEKLDKILETPYKIIQQQAGIRPTVKDRRPLIGIHPEHKNICIFNGLGTKGMMLAPYLAKHFADVLERNEKLIEDVDIVRFKTKD